VARLSAAVLGTCLLATTACVAAQPRAKVAPTTQSKQVFGYTDQAGVTCLTNLAPDPRTNPGYQVIVEADAPQVVAQSAIPSSPELHQWVAEAARREQIDSALIYAVMAVESGFNTRAVSNKGAAGLMQLMPNTASSYGVSNRFDGQANVFAGAHYLRDLLDVFGNNLTLAIAAYNAGENAVHLYHDQVPPFAETQSYVPRVLAVYRQLGGSTMAR
jgi:soluble lytic murein transglycosylase-like protein